MSIGQHVDFIKLTSIEVVELSGVAQACVQFNLSVHLIIINMKY